VFLSSIIILPPSYSISAILNKATNKDDYPAPVRPTHPIFSPERIENVTPFNTGSIPYLYFIITFLNYIFPDEGQAI
jgi:hypothetical protein